MSGRSRLGDPAANVLAVERGGADVALGGGVPLEKRELERLAVRYPNRLRVSSALNTFFFFLNTRVAPFDDVRVRRAVNVAFDREQFVRLLGREFSSTCQILPPNSSGYRPTCPFQPGGSPRLDVAREVVRDAGAVGADVTVWVPNPRIEEARYVVSVLESLGLDARVKAQELEAHFTSIQDPQTGAQMGFYAWVSDFPSAAGFIPPQFGCDAGRTFHPSGFCDPAIDEQMAAASAAQAQDPATATRLWQQVETAVLMQAPVVPTYHRANVDFVSERVGNYQYNPQWGALLDQLWVR
jgi:ABC-type transport system substrate-binding protein